MTKKLEDELPLPVINRFLRRRTGETSDMAYRYNTVQMVGGPRSYYTVVEGELAEDLRVFEVHPFLPLWKGKDSWATR